MFCSVANGLLIKSGSGEYLTRTLRQDIPTKVSAIKVSNHFNLNMIKSHK